MQPLHSDYEKVHVRVLIEALMSWGNSLIAGLPQAKGYSTTPSRNLNSIQWLGSIELREHTFYSIGLHFQLAPATLKPALVQPQKQHFILWSISLALSQLFIIACASLSGKLLHIQTHPQPPCQQVSKKSHTFVEGSDNTKVYQWRLISNTPIVFSEGS